MGARPGSAAARRTKELLLAAGGGSGTGAGLLQRTGKPGSLLDGFSDGRSSPVAGHSNSPAAGAQHVVPKARGLVKGSTDAMHGQARPPSRGV